MSRPLRLEFPDAIYHVTARGNRRANIYADDKDRLVWLAMLGEVAARFNFVIHAYCLMPNHYHLLVRTVDGRLARGMRQLNGSYSQYFNRRHGLTGHLFQGRYDATAVLGQSYLMELARYISLNPVRAQLVEHVDHWDWGSHYYVLHGQAPDWLDTDWLLGQFGSQNPVERYCAFVAEGLGLPSPLKQSGHQLTLDERDRCVERVGASNGSAAQETPRTQKRALALTLEEYEARYADRNTAMAEAYLSMAFSMRQIAGHFGVSYRTVSRAVKALEAQKAASIDELVSECQT